MAQPSGWARGWKTRANGLRMARRILPILPGIRPGISMVYVVVSLKKDWAVSLHKSVQCHPNLHVFGVRGRQSRCGLTQFIAKRGGYASERELGDDMGQGRSARSFTSLTHQRDYSPNPSLNGFCVLAHSRTASIILGAGRSVVAPHPKQVHA